MTSTASSSPKDLTLALCGAEERLQLALGTPGENGAELLAAQEWTVPGQSVRFLVPSLQSMLNALGLQTSDLSRIACVRGPGSFTGLRLSLSVVAALAIVHGLPQAGIDHLALLARGPATLLNGTLAVVTHSRRQQVYVQAYSAPTGTPLSEAAAMTLKEADSTLRTLSAQRLPLYAFGSGLRRNADFFQYLVAESILTPLSMEWDAASPQALLSAACDLPPEAYADHPVEPLYMRPSDAEENLETIARQRGLDPKLAKEMLRRSRQNT